MSRRSSNATRFRVASAWYRALAHASMARARYQAESSRILLTARAKKGACVGSRANGTQRFSSLALYQDARTCVRTPQPLCMPGISAFDNTFLISIRNSKQETFPYLLFLCDRHILSFISYFVNRFNSNYRKIILKLAPGSNAQKKRRPHKHRFLINYHTAPFDHSIPVTL